MIVQTNIWYFYSIKEKIISVNLFNILHKDENFRIYKSKFESDIHSYRKHNIFTNLIEMYCLTLRFFYFNSTFLCRWFIIYFHDFLYPLIFEWF